MKILLTGGTGLIGSEIIRLLSSTEHEIHNLTTRSSFSRDSQKVANHFWNPSEFHLDSDTPSPDVILNLAGFSIANRWTEGNKKKMYDSRIQSIQTIQRKIESGEWNPKCIITASASGFYEPGDAEANEQSPLGKGFLAELTEAWENAWQFAEHKGIRVVKLRITVVLDREEGAVGTMAPFFKWGLGSAVGSGNQKVSWVHRSDVAQSFIHAMNHSDMKGAYNVASPEVVSNRVFSKAMAHAMHRPFILPPVPGFMIKLLFGDMSTLVLQSKNISTQKLLQSGFHYKFNTIDEAMIDIFKA